MLDAILAASLLGLVPAYMLWRSRRGAAAAEGPAGLWRAALLAAGLVSLLAASWAMNGRSASALGLAAPSSLSAQAGFGLAVVILGGFGLALAAQLRSRRAGVEDMTKALEGLPRTPGEAAAFIPSIVLISVAWELLYRGFLLWFLTPRVGLAGAVAISAAAYALAHGYKGARRFAASLLSALLFAIGFAATGSLWWLMLVHAGFPVLGSLAAMRLRAIRAPLGGPA